MKRICLFAGYNSQGCISDYVVYYIVAMAKFTDVYYMCDCDMKEAELMKIMPYVKGAYAHRHKKYDFGSWQELMRKIGVAELEKYDELVLCNDSCFGPLYDLTPIFVKASGDLFCDFWGMTEGNMYHPHIQSYFIVYKKRVFASNEFKDFFNNIKENQKADVVKEYEARLTGFLLENGYKPKTYMKFPFGPDFHWRTMIKHGFPFLKIRTCTESSSYASKENLRGWAGFIKKYSNYDTKLVESHFQAIGFDYHFFDTIQYLVISTVRKIRDVCNWMVLTHWNKRRKIIRLFGIYIIDTRKNTFENF